MALTLKPVFLPQLCYQHVIGSPITCPDLNFFIFLNTMSHFFEEYTWNLDETNYSEKISQMSLCGEQQKPNFDDGDILLIQFLGISCLIILFVIQLPSPDVHNKLSLVSLPTNPM